MKTSYYQATRRQITLYLTNEDIINAIHLKLRTQTAPADGLTADDLDRLTVNSAQVEFEVPSGADWSGMRVDIDQAHPVMVTWEVMSAVSTV